MEPDTEDGHPWRRRPVLRAGHRQHRLRQEPQSEWQADGPVDVDKLDLDLERSVQLRWRESVQYAGRSPVRGETTRVDRSGRSQDTLRRSVRTERRAAARRQHVDRSELPENRRKQAAAMGQSRESARAGDGSRSGPIAVSGIRPVPGRCQRRLFALHVARYQTDSAVYRPTDGPRRVHVLEIDGQRERDPRARDRPPEPAELLLLRVWGRLVGLRSTASG